MAKIAKLAVNSRLGYWHIIEALYPSFQVNTRSPFSNSTTTSHQITQLTNFSNLILNLTSVHQYMIDDIDELHDKFLMTDDECYDEIVKFVARSQRSRENNKIRGSSSNS